MSSSSSVRKVDYKAEGIDVASDTEEKIEDYIRSDNSWWRTPHLVKLNIACFLITLSSTNNGYDGSMLNGLQSLPEWHTEMGNPEGYKLGALSNGTLFGSLIGIPIVPYFVDRWGRRIGIFVGQLLCLLGAILQGVSTNYGFFLGSRLILGVGNSFMGVAAPSLISEISHPAYRGTATAFYNTCYNLGAIIAAWVTYGTQSLTNNNSWRVPSFLQGLIPLIQVLTIWFLPESPRYYVSKDKIEQAERVLKKHHIGNSEDEIDLKLVQFEMREIEMAIELEKINTSSSYMDFIRLKNFRKRTFLICYLPCIMQLSGNGLVSYYLNKVLNSIGITSSKKQLEINGCLTIFSMVIAMVAAVIVKYFRRRTLFLFAIASMLVCYVLWTIFSALAAQRNYPTSLSNAILAFIFLFYGGYNVGASGLPILYVTEIIPYTHRAKGLNISGFGQLLTLIYNGYVNPIAMDAIEWKYYIVWCCMLFVHLLVVYFIFPETSGLTLEEVGIRIFGDNPDDMPMIAPTTLKSTVEEVEKVESV